MSLLDTMITIRDDIIMFGDSKLYMSLEYGKITSEVNELYQRLLQLYGPEIKELLDEYTETIESKEEFIAEHYFEQGFLVGRHKDKKERD